MSHLLHAPMNSETRHAFATAFCDSVSKTPRFTPGTSTSQRRLQSDDGLIRRSPELTVQIVDGAFHRQMGEYLGEIAELLAGRPDLCGVQPGVTCTSLLVDAYRQVRVQRERASCGTLERDANWVD